MRLARAWRRQIFGASLAALLIPAAIVASLAVLSLSGGLRRITDLGQVLTGPTVPGGVAKMRGRTLPATAIDRLASSIAVAGGAAGDVHLVTTAAGSSGRSVPGRRAGRADAG